MPWHITPVLRLVHWTEKPYIVKELGWVRAVLSYGIGRRSHKGGARLVLLSNGTIEMDLISDTCPISPGSHHTTRGAYRPFELKHHPKWEVHTSGTVLISCLTYKRCDGPREINLDEENAWMTTTIRTHFGLTP